MFSIVRALPFVFQTYPLSRNSTDRHTCRSFTLEKTDTGGPPSTNETPKEMGSYCIRATIELNNENNHKRFYEGYDDNLGIVDRVNTMCDRDKRLYGENATCENSKLFFMGPKEECEGHVKVTGDNYSLVVQPWQS